MSFTPMAHHTCFTRLISDILLCPPEVKVKAGECLLPIAAIQRERCLIGDTGKSDAEMNICDGQMKSPEVPCSAVVIPWA